MTEIDQEIADGMPIRPEDHEFFIRVLWKNHRLSQMQISRILTMLEEMSSDNKELKEDVKSIKEIFIVSEKFAKIIKWTAYVVVPIFGLAFAIYTYFHKGHPV